MAGDSSTVSPTFSFDGYPNDPWHVDRVRGFNFGQEWLGGQVVRGHSVRVHFRLAVISMVTRAPSSGATVMPT